jgi:hypothetical protein
MTIREHRLSTTTIPDDYLVPDGSERDWLEDFEKGPIALEDTSEGIDYQTWHLEWHSSNGDFTVTPDDTGVPIVVLNAAGVEQCSFAFDNNGRISIAYITNTTEGHLYWYSTLDGDFIVTDFQEPISGIMLSNDDKRQTQTNINDIIMWAVQLQPAGNYHLYTLEQRTRYTVRHLMQENTFPYVYKCGMHDRLRGQVTLRDQL